MILFGLIRTIPNRDDPVNCAYRKHRCDLCMFSGMFLGLDASLIKTLRQMRTAFPRATKQYWLVWGSIPRDPGVAKIRIGGST